MHPADLDDALCVGALANGELCSEPDDPQTQHVPPQRVSQVDGGGGSAAPHAHARGPESRDAPRLPDAPLNNGPQVKQGASHPRVTLHTRGVASTVGGDLQAVGTSAAVADPVPVQPHISSLQGSAHVDTPLIAELARLQL